jgi:Ca-activated chloride channel family protein
MKAIDQFLGYREGDAFGLTFFGNNVLHWVPLTSDTTAVRCSPPFMRPEVVPSWMGGTEIGKALLACKKILAEREEGDRLIVLVSDGFSFDLSDGNAEKVARELKDERIVVYHIHAADSEIPADVVNLAAMTGGEAFAAGDPQTMNVIFGRIDAMNKARLEKTAPETIDFFRPICIVGLSFLSLACLGSLGLRYTPW